MPSLPRMSACLVLGLGTCLLVGGNSTAADEDNTAAADAAGPARMRREIKNADLIAAMEAALQEIAIANSPPPTPRFASQLGVAEQQWAEDCVDYPSNDTRIERVRSCFFCDKFFKIEIGRGVR